MLSPEQKQAVEKLLVCREIVGAGAAQYGGFLGMFLLWFLLEFLSPLTWARLFESRLNPNPGLNHLNPRLNFNRGLVLLFKRRLTLTLG